MERPKTILVCGGRHLDRWDERATVLDAYLPELQLVIQGGARGADDMARTWARSKDVHCATVPALWLAHGKSAGPRRNSAMALLRPDLVLAFPGGTGTWDMVRKAQAAGIPVERAQ